MEQLTSKQKSQIADLYKVFNSGGSARLRLNLQVIDFNHDSANGVFPLVEVERDANGKESISENSETFLSSDLAHLAHIAILDSQSSITNEFEKIAKSSKEFQKQLLQSEKARIEAQLKELDN